VVPPEHDRLAGAAAHKDGGDSHLFHLSPI
jgi:hypothetical protein